MKTILLAAGALIAWAALTTLAQHLLGVPEGARLVVGLLLGVVGGIPIGLWAANRELSK